VEFKLLKTKFQKEGLFDEKYKKALPRFPESIGIITSRDAAAYTDILKILKNRWGGLKIYLGHVSVQGTSAPFEISEAIEWFNKNHPVDILILSRGGGSLEDLQAFNSENVIRSIFASKIPIITGIGHEKDLTLADLVADIRASTPSNAAEIAIPDKKEFFGYLKQCQNHLFSHLQYQVSAINKKLEELQNRFKFAFYNQKTQINFLKNKLLTQLKKQQLDIKYFFKVLLEKKNSLLNLHPKNILNRGYSITTDNNGRVVKSFQQVKNNDTIISHLSSGKLFSSITKTNHE